MRKARPPTDRRDRLEAPDQGQVPAPITEVEAEYRRYVLAAPSFEDILRRTDMFGSERPGADRLVSVVFANPGSPVWSELSTNRAFLDERTREEWDLFFAGASGFAPMHAEPDAVKILPCNRDFNPYFNPRSFSEIERIVADGHAAARAATGADSGSWRYGGGTDVVSFMVYGRDPDWLSLKSVSLYTSDGFTVGLVVEGLREWKKDVVDPLVAPGEPLEGVARPSEFLIAALGWTASTATAGMVGNGAYHLMRLLVGR